MEVWTQEKIDCDGCGCWIEEGDQVEIVDDDDRYYFCENCQ